MERVRVDWHIHTTLSPCGSLSMDPRTIVDTAVGKGLQVIGITDHNSTRQGRLMKEELSGSDLLILTGAEVTTREEIHCLVFFDDFYKLSELQRYLDHYLPDILNNPLYFGDQVVVDGTGRIVYEEKRLLLAGIDQSLEEVGRFVRERDGLCVPAHINRPAFSILSQLGMIPDGLIADAVEWVPGLPADEIFSRDEIRVHYPVVYGSDAHRPEEIGCRFTELEIDEWSIGGLRQGLARLGERELSR